MFSIEYVPDPPSQQPSAPGTGNDLLCALSRSRMGKAQLSLLFCVQHGTGSVHTGFMRQCFATRGLMAHAALLGVFWGLPALQGLRCAAEEPNRWQQAVDRAAKAAPMVRVVVLDEQSGRLLAAAHLQQAAATLSSPGSTLKPLILFHALGAGQWSGAERIACARKLRIEGHALGCSHAATAPMNAREALAWSCNSYFARFAAIQPAGELERGLRERGLLAATGLVSAESVAALRTPRSIAQAQLLALGVEGLRVTLLEEAVAYRSLAAAFEQAPRSAATQTVRAGLADSASFGMAGAAGLGGVAVLGKTGTAVDSQPNGSSPEHGWFVGLAPADHPQVVVAVYLPGGRGAEAAALAGMLLEASPLKSGSARPSHVGAQ